MGEAFAIAVPLAVIVTTVIAMVRDAVDPDSTRVPSVVWRVVAFALGIGMALVYAINAFDHLGNTSTLQQTTGKVLTGLAIGGFSTGWHEVAATARAVRYKTERSTTQEVEVTTPATPTRLKK